MKENKLIKCLCGGNIIETNITKDGIKLKAQKCPKCNEIYISGSEMLRYDIIKGKSSLVRKIRKSGDSMIVTVPKTIIDKFNIQDGDVVAFEPNEKDIKIKIVHMN